MTVTELGRDTSANLEQPENAHLSIEERESGRMINDKLQQSLNADL